MHRKTNETQNSLFFKTLTFDRNNITLSYLLFDLKFCNDCNKLNANNIYANNFMQINFIKHVTDRQTDMKNNFICYM